MEGIYYDMRLKVLFTERTIQYLEKKKSNEIGHIPFSYSVLKNFVTVFIYTVYTCH